MGKLWVKVNSTLDSTFTNYIIGTVYSCAWHRDMAEILLELKNWHSFSCVRTITYWVQMVSIA